MPRLPKWEQMICDYPKLASDDLETEELYRDLLDVLGAVDRSSLQQQQKEWLNDQGKCEDLRCASKAMNRWVALLQAKFGELRRCNDLDITPAQLDVLITTGEKALKERGFKDFHGEPLCLRTGDEISCSYFMGNGRCESKEEDDEVRAAYWNYFDVRLAGSVPSLISAGARNDCGIQ